MDRIEKIREMEKALDASIEALQKLSAEVDHYSTVQEQMQLLFDYYFSSQWCADCEADSRGEFPTDLKRGVLSEDAVYDLFTDNQRLLEQLRQLADGHKKYPD